MNTAQQHTSNGHHVGGNSSCRRTVDIVGDILEGVRSSGGATVSVIESRTVPSSGYVVAVTGHELRVDSQHGGGPAYVALLVERYVERKRGVVAGSRVSRPAFVGAWVDGDDIVLDVVEILSDRASALEAGAARGELAIWDLAAGEEIRTRNS